MDLAKRRRLSGRWRIMAIISGIVAFAVVAIPEFAQGASAAPAKDRCNSVEFLGARGSGQPWDVTGPDKGFGPEAYKVVTTIAAKLSAKKVSYGEDSSSYPADSVNDLKPSTLELVGLPESLPLYYKDNVSKYLASIATGVSFMVSNVENSATVCGNATRLVLVGYSQGAIVVHQAEDYLLVHDRAALNHIIATVVVADGDRVPNTRAREFGSSGASGEGVQVYLGHFSSHLDMPLPATTANVCNADDIVCNFGIPQVVHFSASAKVHTTSYANCSGTRCAYGQALIAAANWATGVVLKKV
jgi:hypothetical protein